MIPSPLAPKSANWSQGGLGVAGDFDEPMADTCTPGPPAFLEGLRVEALSHERKRGVPPSAAKPPESGGARGG